MPIHHALPMSTGSVVRLSGRSSGSLMVDVYCSLTIGDGSPGSPWGPMSALVTRAPWFSTTSKLPVIIGGVSGS
ncbi:Uncharacterised protein [Mycobacteroides abscessus subsp. abscessus]|nr:Uncharacterised protein [Mycobacteroides abscessus subsp. abscessus]